MIGIYKITNPKGRIYIGQTRNFTKRLAAYKRKLAVGQIRLNRSFKKYGIKNHIFELIEECQFEELNIKERYWQDYYNVLNDNGLNCILTETNILPREISDETRQKLKDNASRYWLGKTKSEEIRKNMSEGQKNRTDIRKVSQETKNKLSELRKGINNPMYGITGANHHSSKKVICTETLEIWDSLNECSKSINISAKLLSRYLTGNRKNKTTIIYLKDYESK